MILNKKSCRYEKIKNPTNKIIHKIHNTKSFDLPEETETIKHHKKHHQNVTHFNYVIPHYNTKIKFVVFNKSSDKPYPGKGFDEKIPNDRIEMFKPLSLIPQWRKKLDNTWIAPFELDDYHWQTVEHYYQANKYKKYPEFYHLFTLESNSMICKDPLLANHAGGKEGKINRKKFRPKEVVIDKKFYETNLSRTVLLNSQYAKFSQHKDLKKILQLTYDATIYYFDLNITKEMFTLMRVRDILLN
jgi:predicted NAD-dependent protein-ADP-ribosyltransferase YbiA (DUF1768 family)